MHKPLMKFLFSKRKELVMLIDEKMFYYVETSLKEESKIEEFEKESGEILGRVMISLGKVPDDLKNEVLKDYEEDQVYVFNCSFYFYDSYLGIALDKQSLNPISSIWISEQRGNADPPSQDWVEFFVRILIEYFVEKQDGFGIPLYIFVNNDSEMVIEPTL